ncbi:MAG TPA: site-specific integrase [Accumulibacter sp.]|nr:site-specific integrase [Accumulibacter sp.]
MSLSTLPEQISPAGPPDSEAVDDLVRHSIASSTRVAYASDLKHFAEWGGVLPASPDMVAAYVAAYAGKLSVATITRRVATLSKAHQAMAGNNPCQSALVKATLQGLRRKHGTAQKQAKALTREDLFAVLDAMGDSMKNTRDRALLLLGFAGGFRRSELVGLDVADIEHVRQGIIITLRHSKTDQEGAGRKIGIPYGRSRHCPVAAVTDWLTRSGITVGAIFRPITRHGHLQAERLSGDAVSEVIRERLAAAGIDPEGYSGHSLRAGFATSAAQAGASTIKIRQQTGHTSDAMLSRYIRDGELFIGNAAGAVL